MKQINIFLDDERFPRINPWKKYDWTIVRNLKQFKENIKNNNINIISFDHDLGKESGMECLNWIIDNDIIPKQIWCHSMNPVGRDNIISKSRSWKKFFNLEIEIIEIPYKT